MASQDFRDILIDRTISVIANEGLDKTTTKAITAGTGINEVYIYRNFSDKEDLMAKTFDKLDQELLDKAMEYVDLICDEKIDHRERFRNYFDGVWEFLLGNKEKCVAFVRYYYSMYFEKNSMEGHKQRYMPLVEKFRPAFIEEADVWMILNYVLDVMLDFAIKVHNGQMSEEDDYAEHGLRVIYVSAKQYCKTN